MISIRNLSLKILYTSGCGIFMGMGSAFIFYLVPVKNTLILPHLYVPGKK
jgi:hypothetical protein